MEINKKDLAGGILKMREVASLLNAWANDLEKNAAPKGRKKGSGAPEAPEASIAAEAAPVSEKPAEVEPHAASDSECDKDAVVESAKDSAPVYKLPEVRKFLSGRCAAGYGAQVRALIASFGVNSLSEVPESKYAELMDSALLLGEEDDGPGSAGEGDAHAG